MATKEMINMKSKKLNRNFIGFEISQEYVKIANKRLSQANLKSWFQKHLNKIMIQDGYDQR